ncbi:alpha/beta fold hydrolase [Schleiferia thermophila]
MTLYSKIYGQGNPIKLIVLHGLFGMGDNWASLAREWSDNQSAEVHLVDMPNHGRSPKSEEFSYESMAAEVFLYMEKKGLLPAILLGHSMGGKAAMFLSTLRPEAVDKLIVVDIAPRYYPVHHTYIIDALKSLNLATSSRSDLEQQLLKSLPYPDIVSFLLKSLHRKSDGGFEFRFNLDVIAKKIEEVGKAFPDYAQFHNPTLFIKGEKSDYIQSSDSEIIKKHFPASRIESIPNAGHWVHAEQPEAVYNLVANFIVE